MERPPALERDRVDLRERRPVPRRRPLLRRRDEGARHARLPRLHGRDERAAAGAVASTARAGARSGSGASPARSRGSSPGSSTSAATTTGASGSAPRGLRRDRRRHDARGRLGRRLHEHLPARVPGAPLPRRGPDRSVAPRGRRDLRARPEHRPRRRDAALVGPVAEGRRHGGGRRAADRGLPAAVDAARPAAAAGPRRVAVRADVAARAAPRPTARARRRGPGGLAWGDGPEDGLAVRGDVGATAWISCAASMPWGGSVGPGARRGGVALVHVGAARGGARHHRSPAAARARHDRPSGGLPVGEGRATSSPTAPRRSSSAGW